MRTQKEKNTTFTRTHVRHRWKKTLCVHMCVQVNWRSGVARHSFGVSVRWCSPPCVQLLVVFAFASSSSSSSRCTADSGEGGGPGRHARTDTGSGAEERAPGSFLRSLISVALTGASQPGHQAINPAWLDEYTCVKSQSEVRKNFGDSRAFVGRRISFDRREERRNPTRKNGATGYVWSVILVCGNASADDVDDRRGPHRAAGSCHRWGPGVISFFLFSLFLFFWKFILAKTKNLRGGGPLPRMEIGQIWCVVSE